MKKKTRKSCGVSLWDNENCAVANNRYVQTHTTKISLVNISFVFANMLINNDIGLKTISCY